MASNRPGGTMRNRNIEVALLPVRGESPEVLPAAQVGTAAALSDDGVISVALANTPQQPVAARLAVAATFEDLQAAVEQRQPVVLVFENGDRLRPIIIGFVQPPAVRAAPATHVIEADVDGKRVRITGQDEIVLQCGTASITMRRNGRVVIRGAYVETHSEGTNRIKGGQVQIN